MTTPTTPSNPETPAQPTAAPAAPASTPSTYTPRPQGQGGYRPGGQGQGGYRPGGPHRSGPGGAGRPSSGPGGGRGGRRMGPPRRKVCQFCAEKVFEVDYKAIHILRNFMTARGKLLAGRTTGNCARHQRQMTSAIKRAQNLALLPFTDA